ncbi:MAG: Holliday junction branch migration protein RuvA [Alphaproteobacteria bacterium]|nr:Holliday junction branch migration protein RuvA [Alphaproteobacteria bacterium]
MISHLKGQIDHIGDNFVVIDVNGIGYKVICSSRTLNAASGIRELMHIFTELIVREDSWTLYGFISENERFWFNKLTSVQGVGGKAAIAILSALSDDEIYNAFLSGDKNVFTKADGIGAKIATRIISELKDKVIGKMEILPGPEQIHNTSILQSNVVNDVISALINLGYQKSDVYRIISSMKVDDDIKFDTLLRQVLSKISSGG